MALTVTPGITLYTDPKGRMVLGGISLDNSYPAGGYTVVPAAFGFDVSIFGMFFQIPALNVTYNLSTGKIQAWAGLPAHTHTLILVDAAKLDVDISRVNAGTNLLGANTGGDLTIAGAGAAGGIPTSTATDAGTAIGTGQNLAAYTGVFIAWGE
jgi:hypothetical protein